MPRRRPNIVFTIADDQRFDMLHAVGDRHVQTPALDRLVERGTCFTHAHHQGATVAAVCIPSRGMLHTGRHLYHLPPSMVGGDHHTYLADPRADQVPPLLGESLRAAGYHTYGVGKWHNQAPSLNRAFADGAAIFFGGMCDHDKVPVHDYDPTGRYDPDQARIHDKFSTDLFTDAAIDFLRRYDGDEPFFLYVAYTSPHDPRTPPPEFAQLYSPPDVPLPPNFLPEHPFDNGEMRVRDELLAPFPRTPEVVQQHLADYYGMVSELDAGLGRLHEALHDTGHGEDTLVIHTADHGLAVGQHGLLGKQNLYDHSVRVPLVIAGPDVPAGECRDALVYMQDLHPTLLDWLDLPVPDTCEFRSFAPVLAGERREHRDSVFGAYRHVQRMVRDERYKLIAYTVGDTRRTQLFDLEQDPWEQHDLSDNPAHAATVARLRQRLIEHQRELDDPLLSVTADRT